MLIQDEKNPLYEEMVDEVCFNCGDYVWGFSFDSKNGKLTEFPENCRFCGAISGYKYRSNKI